MKIHFLYGTETGNSELLCDDMQEELGAGITSRISDMAETDPADLDPDEFLIVVTSTYGNGDLPTTAVSFSDALDEKKPDLSGIRFAIFGLGDMVFAETFAQGSKTLMDQLVACKAEQVGERGVYDASGADLPEDVGVPWMHGILAALQSAAA